MTLLQFVSPHRSIDISQDRCKKRNGNFEKAANDMQRPADYAKTLVTHKYIKYTCSADLEDAMHVYSIDLAVISQ